MRTTRKVLIVGCGQLGSRHLQAVATLPEIGEIHIIDSQEESLSLGKERLKEIPDIYDGIKFYWHKNFNSHSAGGDLCIVATQAKGRCVLIKKIIEELGYKKFLIEKIVSQSVTEYKDLIEYCSTRNVSVWVNCKTRTYGVHQYIKSKLDSKDPFFFSNAGGSHGLANNGIHAADLFLFYDETMKILPAGIRIDPTLLPSKRGSEVFDLGGSIYGTSEKGSDFVLAFSIHHVGPDVISIVSPRGRFIVDHFQKFAYESYPEKNWEWNKISINENWSVSHMSKVFVRDILEKGNCFLPTLKDCYPAHVFILNALLPYFNTLRDMQGTSCPVT